MPDDQQREALRQAGQAYLSQVLDKANKGQDPFQPEPLKAREALPLQTQEEEHPEVAAFGALLNKHKPYVLMGLWVTAQASSWVLIKGCVISMNTPAVLTFLHMLAAVLVQWILTAYDVLEAPHISMYSLKGSAMPTVLHALQVLLTCAVLLSSSVYTLLCWVSCIPLLIEHVFAAAVQRKQLASKLPLTLLASLAGTALEMLADRHVNVGAAMLLVLWALVKLAHQMWQYMKTDATAGNRLSDPELLFHIREVSDAEEQTSPATLMILSNALPAVPVLLLGFLCLEGSSLVDHEPSVPALEVLLVSCAAYAGVCCLHVMLYYEVSSGMWQLLTTAAAFVAIILDFMERARALRVLCLIGVVCAVAGSAMWLVSTKGHALSLKLVGSLPVSTAVLPEDHESQSSTTGSNAMLGNQNVAKMQ
eukprot:jgi/Chrzof1/5090/Cz15g11030.t1